MCSAYSVIGLGSIRQRYQLRLTSEELCVLLMFFSMFESKTLFMTFAFSLIPRVYRYIIGEDDYGLFKMNLDYLIYQVLEYEWASLCPNIIERLAMTISVRKVDFQIMS